MVCGALEWVTAVRQRAGRGCCVIWIRPEVRSRMRTSGHSHGCGRFRLEGVRAARAHDGLHGGELEHQADRFVGLINSLNQVEEGVDVSLRSDVEAIGETINEAMVAAA